MSEHQIQEPKLTYRPPEATEVCFRVYPLSPGTAYRVPADPEQRIIPGPGLILELDYPSGRTFQSYTVDDEDFWSKLDGWLQTGRSAQIRLAELQDDETDD